MKKNGVLILLLLVGFITFAQRDTVGKVKYSPDYKFNDGLFLSFQSVLENKAIPFERIYIEGDYEEFEYIKQFVQQETYTVVDENGYKKKYPKSSIWGFAWKGVLNIYYEDEFNRIPVVGSIAHFVANVTVYSSNSMTNPYSPYSPYGRYGYYDPYRNQPIATKELKQLVLDFETGKIYDYTEQNLEVLFMNEPSIYDEFAALKNRKKRKLKFMYLRKYNNLRPLYFSN